MISYFWHFLISVVLNYHANGRAVYKWEQLTELSKIIQLPGKKNKIPNELNKSCRCQADARRRERWRKFEPHFSSILTGNMRSLANKMHKPGPLMTTQQQENAILCTSQKHGCRVIYRSPAPLYPAFWWFRQADRHQKELQKQRRRYSSACQE